MINLRKYERNMLESMICVFFDAVHESSQQMYDAAQRHAWTGRFEDIDRDRWHQRFQNSHTVVAYHDGQVVGFANLVDGYYIHMMFVASRYQRQGIASKLLAKLEATIPSQTNLEVDASKNAVSFFERKGYKIYTKQEHNRGTVHLINYKMRKTQV